MGRIAWELAEQNCKNRVAESLLTTAWNLSKESSFTTGADISVDGDTEVRSVGRATSFSHRSSPVRIRFALKRKRR